jgi:hypothetical protein
LSVTDMPTAATGAMASKAPSGHTIDFSEKTTLM